ncbi:MAG: hypothetical protein K6D90_09540 [Lachnospiraceae bacterium]|nr:hypothetical protein [Lachnospiraceae bacterium]
MKHRKLYLLMATVLLALPVLTACSAVLTGTTDPDETMKELQEQFEKIGLEKVQTEAQKQLDEYLAQQ